MSWYFPALRLRRAVGFLILTFVAASSFAQVGTGNVFGTVADAGGQSLPGVTVTLSGIGAPRTTITGADGQFRFLSLDPGMYSIRAELAGLGSVARSNIAVNIGRNTVVDMQLQPELQQTITVTAETPLLDVRRSGTGATVTQVELDEVPSGRDPWVVLQQVPGVLMDRINVGGNESGQQSGFVSKGAQGEEATFNVDGVNITDMSATGSSPIYYDFGSFEELQITTGGTDPRIMTPGAQINIVTKRGTNELSGSARYNLADGEWQTDPEIPEEARSYLAAVNEIDQNREWGVEVGGPVLRDRLWLWGAYSDQQVDLFVAQPVGQTQRFFDKTTLEGLSFKLNAQVLNNNSLTGTWTNNSKVKLGRDAAPSRPPETTFNQDAFGPRGIWKIEDTHIFSPSVYLTGMYSKVNGGFQLIPDSGAGCNTLDCALTTPAGPAFLDLPTASWNRTFIGVTNLRPQNQYRLDGSMFFGTGAADHELKLGAGYREVADETHWFWPHDQYVVDYSTLAPAFGLPEGFGGVYLFRGGEAPYEMRYTDFYVGDTILMGNFTINAGLRLDLQETSADDAFVPAHPLIPDILPATSLRGEEAGEMEWDTISPRIGVTYTLGGARRTLLRGAYNRYAGQLGANSAGAGNTSNFTYQYLYYYFVDANDDKRAQREEILFDYGLAGFYQIDPNDPARATVFNRYDDDVNAPITDEFILGVEHELLPEFTVGLAFTHRKFDDFLWARPEKTQGSGDFYTSADYEQGGVLTGTLPDGTTVSKPFFRLKAGLPPIAYFVVQNRPGYSQDYDGVELTAIKRMSNRWMMRGNISWNDWTQNIDASGIIDPTEQLVPTGCSVCDGAEVVQGAGGTSGTKGGIHINSGWSYAITGLYQIPFVEMNLGVNLSGREGYPAPYVHETQSFGNEGGGRKDVLMVDIGQVRHEDIHMMDLRLAKELRFAGVGLTLSADAFNVTNQQTILQRNLLLYRQNAARATGNRITEIVSPRVFRLGARVTF
jgi:hypothetical protein